MTLQNFQQYQLSVGSRNNAVRVVKQLLHSKSDNSYRTDGTNDYTSQLASAVSELQRRHGLPMTGNVGQAEYWALGKNELNVRLNQLSLNDRILSNLLRGGILGSAFAESSIFVEGGQTINAIVMDGDHWVDYIFPDGLTMRRYVLPETKTLLNANAGSLATNVIRAISSCSSLNEFPTKTTKMGLAGSITLQGGIDNIGKGAPTGNAGGAIQMGGSYEKEYDSADGILRELKTANEAIRTNLYFAIKNHKIAVPNFDSMIPDVMKLLGEVPASDADNMALAFVNRAAEKANKLAREMYREANNNKSIPSQFSKWMQDIIF